MTPRITLCILSLFSVIVHAVADDSTDRLVQGRELVQKLLAQHPDSDYTNTGTLHIRDGNGKRTDVLLRCEIHVDGPKWTTIYDASTGLGERLTIIHTGTQPGEYHFHAQNGKEVVLPDDRLYQPLAGSDFWAIDLGAEFLHWPQQKVLKKEIKRSRGCTVLESTNPVPAAGGYSRVVSWIDTETGGFVQAFAYDTNNQVLKEFYPKDAKKVDGHWQIGMMEMDNDQTGGRTRLEFNLDAGSPEK